MTKVFITGASGFLGSYIIKELYRKGTVEILALKRSTSNLWRCDEYNDQIKWLNLDEDNWTNAASDFQPDVIIHGAWSGVSANDRLNWKGQLENLDLLIDLLQIAKNARSSRFIGLGSQAEYGTFSGKISEVTPAKPNTAYGAIKQMSCNLTESFCIENNIEWFWLRLFPLFGAMEDLSWLLPSVMKNIFMGKEMDLTPGLQRYAYLHVEDFSKLVCNIVFSPQSANSGIYNISSTNTISLKELVERIRDNINPSIKLNFGALPYRHYQSMHMEGDMDKYKSNFGEVTISDFDTNIKKTINYYIEKFKENGN